MIDPMMQPAAYTRAEGGEWKSFFDSQCAGGPGGEVHSVVFVNGAIFDTVNGWRRKPRIRIKMGRSVIDARPRPYTDEYGALHV